MNRLVSKIQNIGINVVVNENSIEFNLSARPGSKKERVLLDGEGGLKLCINARPVEGAANKSICRFLARYLGVSNSSIEIVKGSLSKRKRVRINYFFTDHKDIDYYCERWDKLISEFL